VSATNQRCLAPSSRRPTALRRAVPLPEHSRFKFRAALRTQAFLGFLFRHIVLSPLLGI
jgi:hypothetical protein